jgi:hypothetical protein
VIIVLKLKEVFMQFSPCLNKLSMNTVGSIYFIQDLSSEQKRQTAGFLDKIINDLYQQSSKL